MLSNRQWPCRGRTLTRRGTYTVSRRNRTPSPGPRGNFKLSTAIAVLPPGRAAHELQKLTDVKEKRSRDQETSSCQGCPNKTFEEK